MPLELRPAIADDIRTFITWRYEPPHDVYDITDNPEEAVEYFLSSDVRCHAMVEKGELIGYATFGHDARVPGGTYDDEALDIGMGIDPELTGGGRGSEFVEAAVDHAGSVLGAGRLRVTIAQTNERALNAARQAGFNETARFTSTRQVLGTTGFKILER
jgi:RimJ/RimL family protein N-acetyltransferase